MLRYIYAALIAVLIFGLSCSFFKSLKAPKDALTFSVVYQVDKDDAFQVFYAKKDNNFTENNSQTIDVLGNPKFQKIEFALPLDVKYLRFDIGKNNAQKKVKIKEINLKSQHICLLYTSPSPRD